MPHPVHFAAHVNVHSTAHDELHEPRHSLLQSTEQEFAQSLPHPVHPVHPPEHSDPQFTLHVTVHPTHDVSHAIQLTAFEDAELEHPEQCDVQFEVHELDAHVISQLFLHVAEHSVLHVVSQPEQPIVVDIAVPVHVAAHTVLHVVSQPEQLGREPKDGDSVVDVPSHDTSH